jgi:hypothetical protein
MDYNVYFEIGGKKLCQKVTAKSPKQAKDKVKSDIIFHKVNIYKESEPEPEPEYKLPLDQDVQNLMDLLNIRT